MSIRRMKTGRYQATVEDARQGIKRMRRTFDTRREAVEWRTAVKSDAHAALLGRRRPRLFGEALYRYLEEISPSLRTHTDNLRLAGALRWPIRIDGGWTWLELAPLEAPPGQINIINALAAWRADMRQIKARAYLGHAIYHLRPDKDGFAWYRQDPAAGNKPPPPRVRVTDSCILADLEETDGRGPYSSQTLRTRQALVKSVLRCAWRDWDWTGSDLSGRINLEKPAPGRQLYLTQDQLGRLIEAAAASEYGRHLADAIEAAALIGWRRANMLGLTWRHVVMPTGDDFGYLIAPADETKNGKPLTQPISTRLEAILRARQAEAIGSLVFHRGDGQAFGDFRKTWHRVKELADVDPELRWHDLRHTWASRLVQAGATDRQLMELGGWTSPSMPRRYAHLRMEHLRDIVNK